MCNNQNTHKSETEYLMAVHGVLPVIATPIQSFQCGKCGTQNLIPTKPTMVDCRENCHIPGLPFCAQPDEYKEYFHERVRATKRENCRPRSPMSQEASKIEELRADLTDLEFRHKLMRDRIYANQDPSSLGCMILLALFAIPIGFVIALVFVAMLL